MAVGKKELTLFNIISDPSIVDGKDRYRDIVTKNNYKTRYVKYIQRHEVIPLDIYANGELTTIIYHFKLKSDNDADYIHDVVFKFSGKKVTNTSTIKDMPVQMFSNSQGFVYNFAYVVNKNGLLIPELADKLGDSIRIPPERNNPSEAMGFDYTIFFCAYYLQINDFYLRFSEINRKRKPLDKFDTDDIASFEEAIASSNQVRNTLYKKAKRTAQSEIKQAKRTIERKINQAKKVVNKVKTVKTAKLVKTIKPRKKI